MLTLKQDLRTVVVMAATCGAVLLLGLAGAGPDAGREKVLVNDRIVAVPGTGVRLRLFEARNEVGETVPHYSIKLEGKGYSPARATSYEVKLRHGEFEPLAAGAPPVGATFAADDDTNLYIVQFATQPLEVFREAVADLGGEVYFYLPRHSHIVKLDPAARDAVEALPYVRWVGPYHPAYRMEEFLVENAERADELYPLQTYNIMIHRSDMDTKVDVADAIEAIGGKVEQVHAGKFLVRATLTPDQLFQVARLDEVLFIDRWGPLEPDMNNSREVSGANYVESVAGFTGEGVRGEAFDTGFNIGHGDFASRPLIVHGTAGSDSHGAATSGICFGDGTGNPDARGILPSGQGIVSNYSGIMGSDPARYDHTGELVAAPYFGVFQTSSVGSPRTFFYTTISADNDAALFDFDVVHCQSQSNAGNQDSRPQAWAKNIISGGGVRHYDTADKSDDCWCGGGSTGPASDGRIKPDLCHFYDDTLTTTTGGPTSYTTSFGGTSGATPNICGYTGLFFQMWSEGIFGNDVDPGGTVFENRCHMTTAKAVMINTAEQYVFSGTSHDLTRVHQGWGMPNVANIWDRRNKLFIVDEADVLGNLESIAYVLAVDPGEPEFKATLVFADPPGNPAATEHRINDLTLKVTSPGGTEYWGNNGLLANNYSTPDGSPNTVDTVECVFVQNPEAGAWVVEVFADEIIEDSHIETPEIDADFALVVGTVDPISEAGFARFGGTHFQCEDSIDITVTDAGLNTDPGAIENVAVQVHSDTEPAGETVILTETAMDSGAFGGPVTISATDGAGIVHVTEGDVVTLTYIDADDGQGGINVPVTDTAMVDCTAPVISNVLVDSVGPFDAWISFQTDEPTDGTVRYGTSCGSLTGTAVQVGSSTDHLVHVVGLNENTTYYFAVDAEDAAGIVATDDNGSACYSFSTTDIPLYFTEQFSAFDLDGTTMTLTPDGGVDGYIICVEPITELPTDPVGGTPLGLSDDGSTSITPGTPVVLYGTSHSSFFVNSNGNITMDAGDGDYTESISDHFDQPRVSALFDDLNPTTGGTISWLDLADRVVVSWESVPEYSNTGANTFQIEMFHDGRIAISWLGVSSSDSIVGISEGTGVPASFFEIDLSNSGPCVASCLEDCAVPNDGIVDVSDLLDVLSQWALPGACDVDGNGRVMIQDLLAVLAAWGTCQ
jgi:hypothetical protein